MRRRLLVGSVSMLALVAAAAAQTTSSAAAPATPYGFMTDYLAEIDVVGQKLVALAEAMPADKYAWRPAADVRSVGEVYMHVVAGNSTLPSFLGFPRMEGISRESEKTVTDKAKIVAYLKASVANARAAAAKVPEADLEHRVKTFGAREETERAVLFRILNHMHEHLGQSIAYARMSGVTPPWSRGD